MRPLRVLGDLRAIPASDIRLVQISTQTFMRLKKRGNRSFREVFNSTITAR